VSAIATPPSLLARASAACENRFEPRWLTAITPVFAAGGGQYDASSNEWNARARWPSAPTCARRSSPTSDACHDVPIPQRIT
jgi:hypothetical protein